METHLEAIKAGLDLCDLIARQIQCPEIRAAEDRARVALHRLIDWTFVHNECRKEGNGCPAELSLTSSTSCTAA